MQIRMKHLAALFLLASVLLTRAQYAHQDTEKKHNHPGVHINPDIEAIRKQISGLVEKYGGSGALPGISYEFYYAHDPIVVAGKELGPLSEVSIASTTKSFTSFAMVRLAREGKVDLDAPVARYLPDWGKHEIDRNHPATVRHLLQHRSGIPYAGGKSIQVGGMFVPGPRVVAGRYFEYSNFNYELVARIMEKTTGKSFAQVMEDLVIRPLGLKHTHLAGFAHGSSGVASSTSDMSAFADFLIQDFELYREGSYIQELARPPVGVPVNGNQEFYALGWRVTYKNGQLYSMFHSGEWNQGVSILCIYPLYSASYAYLANPPDYRPAAVQDVKGNLIAYSNVLAEKLAKSLAQHARQQVQRAPANAYLGKYRSEYNKISVNITVRNNRLALQRGGQVIPLVPLNDWEFQGDSPWLTYQFFFDEKNRVIGMTDYTSYYAKEDI